MVIAQKWLNILYKKGITINEPPHWHEPGSVHMHFTTSGVAWIMNWLYCHATYRTSPIDSKTLREIAKWEPEKMLWRPLFIRFVYMPVGCSETARRIAHKGLCFYLHGDPPKMISMFPLQPDGETSYNMKLGDQGAFYSENNQLIRIHFTHAEMETLERGEVLMIQVREGRNT